MEAARALLILFGLLFMVLGGLAVKLTAAQAVRLEWIGLAVVLLGWLLPVVAHGL